MSKFTEWVDSITGVSGSGQQGVDKINDTVLGGVKGLWDDYTGKSTANDNLEFQREQFEYQKQQNALTQEREDNAVSRRTQDLINSGLSPLAETQGAQTSGGMSTSMNGSQWNGSASALNGLANTGNDIMSTLSGIQMQKAQIKNLNADTEDRDSFRNEKLLGMKQERENMITQQKQLAKEIKNRERELDQKERELADREKNTTIYEGIAEDEKKKREAEREKIEEEKKSLKAERERAKEESERREKELQAKLKSIDEEIKKSEKQRALMEKQIEQYGRLATKEEIDTKMAALQLEMYELQAEAEKEMDGARRRLIKQQLQDKYELWKLMSDFRQNSVYRPDLMTQGALDYWKEYNETSNFGYKGKKKK